MEGASSRTRHPRSRYRLILALSLAASAFLLVGSFLVFDPGRALVSGSVAASCAESTSASQRWPGPCWRPFSRLSPFNRELPANPRIAPGSGRMIERLVALSGGRGPAALDVYRGGQGGDPTYWSDAGDPTFVVHCTRPWGRCPLEGRRIHAPAGAMREWDPGGAAADQDGHISIIDRADDRVYDLWQVRRKVLPRGGGRLLVSWGGVTSLSGKGIDGRGDATAARFSNIAGRLRAEELAVGRIEHALFIVIPCDAGKEVFPARAGGAPCRDEHGALPMGARLQLDYTDAEIEALPVPIWKKALLRAMADYGMFVGDTGTHNLFSVERESGLQYRSAGDGDRWLNVARSHHFEYWHGEGGVYIGDLATGVDWTRLRVIAPCVSAGSCR